VVLSRGPRPPTDLRADAVAAQVLGTRLSWTASPDPVTLYRVYVQTDDDPVPVLSGETVATSMATGHPWASDSGVPTRVYVIAPVGPDGVEGFFSNRATNYDRDHDGLTDQGGVRPAGRDLGAWAAGRELLLLGGTLSRGRQPKPGGGGTDLRRDDSHPPDRGRMWSSPRGEGGVAERHRDRVHGLITSPRCGRVPSPA
jgi:hypothetical protein